MFSSSFCIKIEIKKLNIYYLHISLLNAFFCKPNFWLWVSYRETSLNRKCCLDPKYFISYALLVDLLYLMDNIFLSAFYTENIYLIPIYLPLYVEQELSTVKTSAKFINYIL